MKKHKTKKGTQSAWGGYLISGSQSQFQDINIGPQQLPAKVTGRRALFFVLILTGVAMVTVALVFILSGRG